jgi:hypothetical protein
MPRLVNKHQSYRHHKGSGQAVVTVNGRDVLTLNDVGTLTIPTAMDDAGQLHTVQRFGSFGGRAAGRHPAGDELRSDDGGQVTMLLWTALE